MPNTIFLPADLPLRWASGGFTLALNYQPDPERYLVSERGGAEFPAEPTLEETAAFVAARWSDLARANAYLGGWRDPVTGRYYLDVSHGFASRAAAIDAGRAHGQRAIFDSESGVAIATIGQRAGCTVARRVV